MQWQGNVLVPFPVIKDRAAQLSFWIWAEYVIFKRQ